LVTGMFQYVRSFLFPKIQHLLSNSYILKETKQFIDEKNVVERQNIRNSKKRAYVKH
jgi:hypothetical protein